MREARAGMAIVLGATLATGLACSGLFGGGEDSEVDQEIGALEGTSLDGESDALPTLVFDGSTAAAPEFDEGDGVQILHAAPYGPGQKAVQVAVVFDRPMVALTDLDQMTGEVPLKCTPEVGAKARWAGTSTAVLIPPDGAFPAANTFECSIPAGLTAVDGVKLEKGVSWTFETPRPRVISATPSNGAREIDPAAPIELLFDQPVDPAAVAAKVTLRDGGRTVAVKGSRPADLSDQRVHITGKLDKNSAYTLAVEPGVPSLSGPLKSEQPFATSFQTYPPIGVELHEPVGEVSPAASLSLHFSTRVSRDEVAAHLEIEPKPDGWSPPTGEWEWNDYGYNLRLQPRTDYTIRLTPGVTDAHGQKLADGQEWTFRTGDYDPWLDVPQGLRLYAANNPPELPFKHLNASSIDAVAFPFDPHTLTVPGQWSEQVRGGIAGRGVPLPVDVDPAPNQIELDQVGFASMLRDGRGWIATHFSAPNVLDWNDNVRSFDGLFVVTDLGGTLKIGPGGTEVWVTSLSAGAPVEGAAVELFVGAELAERGTTAKDGTVRLSAPTASWSRWGETVWARITKGTDVSLVVSNWDDGMEPWGFGIYNTPFQSRQIVSHGFADRGIYRLGDPVYARSTWRSQTAKGLEQLRGEVHWTLVDPEGSEVATGDGSIDARGGFSVETKLPAEGPLGDWSITMLAAGDGWQHAESVPVPARAYRAPAFRVQVVAPPAAVAGDEVRAGASVRYLFGAPLKKGAVKWRAWTEDRSFSPEGWDGWSFDVQSRWWEDEDEDGETSSGTATLGNEDGTLTDGSTSFAQRVEPGFRKVPVDLFLEAEVTDVDNQVIANRSVTRVHPAAFYVGVKTTQSLPKAGEPVTLQVAAVEPAGTARAEQVSVSVVRREWDSVREKGMDGQWRWVNTVEDTPVTSQTVSTGASPATMSFTPDKSGYYVAIASAKDARGNEAKAEYGVYAVGKGYVGWGRRDDNHMELVSEKRRWKPGETARILVKAPAEGLQALVTVEREGVLWKKVVTLGGTASTVEVPITAAFQPNVFVSVVAVQGAGPQDAPDKGRPQVYVGMTELVVDPGDQRLDVAIAPSAEVYRPRDEVTVKLAVKRAGAPVAGAGVTLYAVDEAILSLTDYETPDSFGTFYAHHGLSVATADGRTQALDRAPYLTKGANRGGGGGLSPSGPEVRNKFVTTVTWQPDLRTGADGTVEAKFTLPDNLTTFRIMAVADAGSTSFGSADREIRVTRPLIVRPALPRLLRQDDRAYAGVVVHNNAERDRWVRVTAEVSGPVEIGGSPADVKVPAGGSVEVPFSLRALEQGQAKFTFTATSGNDRDAVEWALPVEREVPLDTVATSGRVEPGKSITEKIAKPDGANDAWGGLTVDVATTALVGAGSGIEYLRAYPHECAEQLTSRTLGNLMALQVRERAQIAIAEDVLRASVEDGLSRLARYRNGDGGLRYWANWSGESSVMATAYGVELMGRAKEAKFEVDQELLDGMVGYLRDMTSGRRSWPAHWRDDKQLTLVSKAYIASALARAGAGDAGLNNEVFGQRQQLSVFGTATLLEAIARTSGADARTAELARTIASRTYVEPTEASIRENDADRWDRLWGSDDLSTAAALEALVRAGSDNPLVPKYATHLAESKVAGRWANTRATAGVLAALAAYAEVYEADTGSQVKSKVTLAGKSVLSETLAVPASASNEIPMRSLASGPLEIGTTGGALYYEARLTYAERNPPPRDEGFAVQRTLEVVEDGGPDGRIVEGTLLRVTLSVVTPVTRDDVALRDPIPAGLEPVDTSLATASAAPDPDEDEAEQENLYDLGYADTYEERTTELPDYGGSWVFDHHEIDDGEVRLYASYMPPGVHTFRYMVRATSPGTYVQPAATAEEMYQPENFGRTKTGTLTVGGGPESTTP